MANTVNKRNKVATIVCSILVLCIVVITVGLYLRVHNTTMEFCYERIKSNLHYATENPESVAKNFDGQANVILLKMEDGSVAYDSWQTKSFDVDTQNAVDRALNGSSGYFSTKISGIAGDMYYYYDSSSNGYAVVLAAPERVLFAEMYQIQLFFIMFFVLEVALILCFMYLTVKRVRAATENAALQESYKAMQKEREAQTVFLSNISHDLRTPLNTIMGSAKLAGDNSNNSQKVSEYVDNIKTAGFHLTTLIGTIIDMLRIQNGNVKITNSPNNIVDILKESLSMVADVAEEKHIPVNVSIKVSNPFVYCDRVHLNQLTFNLLDNAIKYTNPGGHISLSLTGEKENFTLRIKDSGVGMSPDFINHLFEPFKRVSISDSTIEHNSGLGLVITKNIVDMMGGSIAVKSEGGLGTEFIINFKFALQEDTLITGNVTENEMIPTNDRLAGKRLLLVEDNELNREIAKDILLNYGFQIEDVEDGMDAVSVMERAQPGYFDAIIMDIQMPKLNGYDATRRIRAMSNPEIASIPIVAMTANAFDEDIKAAKDCGMDAHIAKPLEPDDLLKALNKLIK